MNDPLSANKRALLKIRELKQQLAAAQALTDEPIAIVSHACRFPRNSATPERFWQSLIEKTDEVSGIPADRWDLEAFYDEDPEVPGKMYARHGVFLDEIDKMDPEFFGISPREATWVDPQQRLLMEVGWEAIERAGWIPSQIGEHTGIFVGWMHNDYQNEASDSFLNLNPYIATGAAGSFLCGRLAYYLGLQGPSVAVDTACSSSLVALHLAIQSLQRRDCDRALVGGVNVICSPTTNILTCKLKALSPQGHSRAFDASADGYLRGEGCGVVTLRRLADAERGGDPILGIIRGSAVGHNGFSSGLTAPNPKAQEKVIRQALQRGGIRPQDISYLEAHGTGTELGDPIEMQAAAAALSEQRSAGEPLLVGSVKTNIGHLEAAAGMAGLIKVLLAMQHDVLPGQLHFENPNPHIPWDKIPVRVLTHETTWPHPERKLAGVSAFGMSGTNAHVVIESPQRRRGARNGKPFQIQFETQETSAQACLLTVSGKSDEAVNLLAEAYAASIRQSEDSLQDIAYTTSVCRSHFEQRAAVVGESKLDAVEKLIQLSRGGTSPMISRGTAKRSPRVAWQFTGQGSQYPRMAQGLLETHPVFRNAIEQCDAWLSEIRTESLLEVLRADDERIHHTYWTQPAIFAVQMGLSKLLESWGITPSIVMGHSVGQFAAACVAGYLSWQDGLRLIAERGRLIGELPSGGKMLAVFQPIPANTDNEPRLDETSWLGELLSSTADLSVAAYNGTHFVLSGPADSILRAKSELESRQTRCKELETSHAFHSSLMDPALPRFERYANQVSCTTAQIPLVCNVTGEILPPDARLDGAYWANHIRRPVRYSQSIKAMQERGCDLIVELGPHAVLTRMAAATWQGAPNTLISCLDKASRDDLALTSMVGQLYAHGVSIDFQKLQGSAARHVVPLPTYPFQRRRFWGPDKPRAFHAEYHTAHPLLGSQIQLAGLENEVRYEGFIDVDSPTWLPDHEVMGRVVFPGAGFIEMAIALAVERGDEIRDLLFEQPLRPQGRTALQTAVRNATDADAQPHRLIETYASAANANQWQRNFRAALVAAEPTNTTPLQLQELEQRLTKAAKADEFYAMLARLGLNYGSAFQTIQSIRYSESEVFSELRVSGDVRGYHVAPTLLDGAFHSLAVGLLHDDDDHLFLPVSIERVTLLHPINEDALCHARWRENEGKIRVADLTLYTKSGDVALQMEGLRVQQVSLAALRQMSGDVGERLVYEIQWQPQRLPASNVTQTNWLLVGSQGSALDTAEALARRIRSKNHTAEVWSLQDLLNIAASQLAQFDGIAWCLVPDASVVTGVNAIGEQHDPVEAYLGSARGDQVESILHFLQSMLGNDHRNLKCGFQFITANAISIGSSGETQTQLVEPAQSQYWGLARVISAEQPGLRCRMIDLSLADTAFKEASPSLDAAADILLTETQDNQFAIREGQLFVPRLKRSSLRKQNFEVDNSAFLVTGGLGKLGLHVAKWLADKGAQQIVLVSRRAPHESALAEIAAIEALGCEVIVHSADMSSAVDVANVIRRFGSDYLPLRGVIHAAGVIDDGLMESQTWERFERVLAPKVRAAWLLHEQTKHLDLQLFVLYSSAASVLGSPGQSNYATGNGFLDGLAWRRQQLGLPALAVNWGPWTEGMADDERLVKRLAMQGITPLTVDEAHAAMEKLLVSEVTQATVMDVDWRRMQRGPGADSSPLLQSLVETKRRSRSGDSALVGKLKSMSGNEQRQLLLKTIQDSLQRILSTADLPETDRPLIEMGLDSLMAVEFGTELQAMLGDQFAVGPTMLFDHPTIDAICDHVLELITADNGSTNEEAGENAASAMTSGSVGAVATVGELREDIAIIGMSCRFPGARDVNEFWQNLLNGVDAVRDIPDDRWDIDRFYSDERVPGKMYSRQGGFIEDIADFDADFFHISEREACWIDPQHRLLLENSYHALEDAGIATHPLSDANVGVFMGIMGQDYAFLPTLDDEEVIRGFQGAGLSHSAGVGRISYMLGFEGPSVAIDTASSSSLVALLQAVRSLQSNQCNLALAGGVNAILAPVNSLLMSKAGLLAPDGRCKSFSAAADGFGRGEGCGVVVLKRLSEAQRDGDRVLAVIRGGAIVHNGFTGAITSPSSKAQKRVIEQALADAQLAPSQIQYLEAHGTGTELGDPMEIGAAVSVYGKGRRADQPLLVGSVKANISHLEAAGGISGLIKTVLAIQHGVIPRQIHLDEPSPHIPWQRMPLKLVAENTPWPAGEERLAGITALGLVGTNAHVIISSPPATPDALQSEPVEDATGRTENAELLVISARSEVALRELAMKLANFIATEMPAVADLCFTAGVGRRHLEHRAAFVVHSLENANEKLRQFAQGNNHACGSDEQVAYLQNSRSGNGDAAGNGNAASNGDGNHRQAAIQITEEGSSWGVCSRQPNVGWLFGDKASEQDFARLQHLYQSEPLVRETIDEFEQRLSVHLQQQRTTGIDWKASLDGGQPWTLAPQVTQFILQACLSKLLLAWNLEPDLVVGSGVGQYTAYCVAGGLGFGDALILVYEQERFRASEEPDWDRFEQLADTCNFYPPHLPMICSVTGEVVPVHRSLGGRFWRELATSYGEVSPAEPAADVNGPPWLAAFASESVDVVVEIGRNDETIRDEYLRLRESREVHWLRSLAAHHATLDSLMAVLGKLYTDGKTPDFNALHFGKKRQRLALPVYPFQKKRYWITEISQYLSDESAMEAPLT